MDLVTASELTRVPVSKCILLPRTSYHFRVIHIGSNQKTSPWSSEVTFATDDYKLDPVRFDLSSQFNRDVVANAGDSTNDPFGDDSWYMVEEGFDGTERFNPKVPGLPRDRVVGVHLLGDYDELNSIHARVGDEGVVGMKVGGKRKLTIPSDLAYGKKGSPPKIPADAPLVFEIELLEILDLEDEGGQDAG